ncbi:MAG: apolipoprotein N-acyltransferase [Candidatus Muproteobacteria bacterium RBG_16_60_9]|uniref:Apolipoprotein N-acyltransferase n=1 Tax=Candidatus Muproteobacteria bacterium RBG_16_60_9 TaxID=1817755 RepID=A0A1F6VGI2_9PROT|nr:MAG: apolipoprotein N-acyltransferase [Candidatus Muproteobacteria bacterium RBG_16_60_9]
MIPDILTHEKSRNDFIALLAGAATPLAFAPFDLFPLALLAPAVLFVLWNGTSGARAAWRGFLFGFGMFGVGVSWIYVSLHTYGNMPAPLAGLAVVFFVALLAAFPAAVGWLQAYFQTLAIGWRLVLVAPAIWVLLEWSRSWFLTGFPWLHLGYSQVDTPLAAIAPLAGVYGVSFAAAASAGLLAAAWVDRRLAGRLYVPAAAALWIVAWLIGSITWVQPLGAPIQAALVQGNTPLTVKWRPEYRNEIVDKYLALSDSALGAQLIVWPEAAVPDYFDRIGPTLVPRIERIAKDRDADFLVGAIERDPGKSTYYNSVFVIGGAAGSYRKQHLVPFGEFLPLPALLGGLLNYLQIPMSNFSVGTGDQALLRAAGHVIGVSVCYEDAFGEEVIKALPAASLLVNVSEDSWFGRSFAPHQRLQMARMRAIEAGRPMLRAANTGPSAIIDHRGLVLARSPQFQSYVLQGSVQPTVGATAYARIGNVPVVSALLIVLGALAWRARRLRSS